MFAFVFSFMIDLAQIHGHLLQNWNFISGLSALILSFFDNWALEVNAIYYDVRCNYSD